MINQSADNAQTPVGIAFLEEDLIVVLLTHDFHKA